MLVAIGSPALAGYSLAITRLNGRWLSRQFLDLRFPNKADIPLVFSVLQHVPFRIEVSGSLLPSLIVLPQNDRYWKLLGVAAKRTRQWSIPVAMNILWAVVAFLFTFVDSIADLNSFYSIPGDAGYSINAIWTYLLPVVVGWLYVGSQPEPSHLHDALNDAHETAYVATASEPVLATRVIGRSTRAIEPSTKHIDYANADEKKSAPVFNYARVFIWSQHAEHLLRLYQRAAAKAEHRIPVRPGDWMGDEDGTIAGHSRVGNEAEVIRYCTEDPKAIAYHSPRNEFFQFPTPLTPHSAFPPSPEPSTTVFSMGRAYSDTNTFVQRGSPNGSSKYDEETLSTGLWGVPKKPVFATGVFQRVVFATVLALGLQWGTTGAAILIHLNTPPKGIGCRGLTFIIFGTAGTTAFLLLLFSSVLAHLTRRQNASEKRSYMKTFIGCVAAFTRWLGKLIAIANAFMILASCIAQFAGVYDNCFCSSTTFVGHSSRVVAFTPSHVQGSQVYWYWIGGTVIAFGVSGFYSFAIYIATPMG